MVRTILAVMLCWRIRVRGAGAVAESHAAAGQSADGQRPACDRPHLFGFDRRWSRGAAGFVPSRYFLASLAGKSECRPSTCRSTDSANATLVIQAAGGTKAVQELGEDESYQLNISNSGARLNAPTTLGVMRGLQTFLQLVQTTSAGFAVPAVSIDDSPRFPWRGLMIDVGRHFIPLDVLKRNLDGMAAVKLNVFHWHLSENQGFRVESKKFPKLQEMGSDGLYYTQDEVRDLIAYARERGIRVVPEFDMPGHATAWFVGYPELASGPDLMRSSASGAFSIPPWIPPGRKLTSSWTHSSAKWPRFFPTSFFISEATR